MEGLDEAGRLGQQPGNMFRARLPTLYFRTYRTVHYRRSHWLLSQEMLI